MIELTTTYDDYYNLLGNYPAHIQANHAGLLAMLKHKHENLKYDLANAEKIMMLAKIDIENQLRSIPKLALEISYLASILADLSSSSIKESTT